MGRAVGPWHVGLPITQGGALGWYDTGPSAFFYHRTAPFGTVTRPNSNSSTLQPADCAHACSIRRIAPTTPAPRTQHASSAPTAHFHTSLGRQPQDNPQITHIRAESPILSRPPRLKLPPPAAVLDQPVIDGVITTACGPIRRRGRRGRASRGLRSASGMWRMPGRRLPTLPTASTTAWKGRRS